MDVNQFAVYQLKNIPENRQIPTSRGRRRNGLPLTAL